MDTIKQKAISGVRWNLINQVLDQGTKLVSTIVLARMLMPEDFGLLGMVVVILNFLAVFFEMGFGTALIQKEEVTQKDYDTIFWFNVLLGLLIAVGIVASAPLIADFYQNDDLIPLARFLCIAVAFNSLVVVPNAIITRNIDFKKITMANNASLIFCLVVAIVLAYLGYGVWAIAVQYVLLAISKAVTYFIFSGYKPSFDFSKSSFKSMLPYGLSVTGNRSLDYWGRNADNLLIAKYLGDFYLGIYTRAYQIMLLPVKNISSVIAKVLFPVFSRQQKDAELIARYYLRVTKVVSTITFPLMMGLFLVADEFVLAIFGEQWIEMAPALKVMCFLGMIQSIQTFNGTIYNALSKVNLAFKLGLAFKAVFIIGFIVGIALGGFMGLIYGYLVASVINLVPNLYFSLRLINLNPFKLLKNVALNLVLAVGLMLVVLALFHFTLPGLQNIWIGMFAKLFVYAGIFTAALYVFNREIFTDIKLLRKK